TIKEGYANLNQHVCIIRLKEHYNYNFIGQFIISPKGQKRIFMAQSGGSREGLNFNEISKIKFNLPDEVEEQQKIGDFFSKLDRQIELEEEKLALLVEQKKGYMQKIFSQKLRFKDENGEEYPAWEEKELGDISNKGVYGIGATATEFDGENVYVRITDINEVSRKLNQDQFTSPDRIDKKYLLKENDILFARTGASTGKSYIHRDFDLDKKYYFAGFLIKFEIKEGNMADFIYHNTLTKQFENWVSVMSVRSGQPGINSEEYAKFKFSLPIILEQQKIGNFFSKLDRQIEIQSQKIDLLKQRKQGFLQKMFV
ncbi:restriction endonuclease subunit S, partial [Staphylococcus delphini]